MKKTYFLLLFAISAMNATAQHYAKGQALITSVEQISSDISSSTEGSLSNLIDGVVTGESFWSTGDVKDLQKGLKDDHYHYLQVDLGKACRNVFFSMSGRRAWYLQFPTAIKVEGSNDLSTWTVVNDNASNISTPWQTDHKNYLYAFKEVSMNTPYRYLRFSFLSNIEGSKKGNFPCAQLGEFQVYEGVSETNVTIVDGYTALCSAYPLDFSDTPLKAYIVKEAPQNGKVLLSPVQRVPAHTGIILSGLVGTYQVPVADVSNLDNVSGNKVVGIEKEMVVSMTNPNLLVNTAQFASDFTSTTLGGQPDDRFLGLIDQANLNNETSQWRTEDNIPSKDCNPVIDRQYHYLQVNLGGCYQTIKLMMQKSAAWLTVFPKTIDILATNDVNGAWTTVKAGFAPKYNASNQSDDQIDLGAKYQFVRLVVKENHASKVIKANGDNYPIFLLGELQVKGINTQTFVVDASNNKIAPLTSDKTMAAGSVFIVLTNEDVSAGHAIDNDFYFEREVALNEDVDVNAFTPGLANVALTRKFNAGVWNTLVLPFSMSAEQMKTIFGSDAKVANYKGATQQLDGTYTLAFATSTTGIAANVPVLIYGANDLATYKIENVNLQVDEPVVKAGGFNFMGSYNKTTTQKADWFISSDNKFYQAVGTEVLKPFHAVFRPTSAAAGAKALSFVLTDDGKVTAIDALTGKAVPTTDAPLYNVAGQRVNKDYKGIVIQNGKKYINR